MATALVLDTCGEMGYVAVLDLDRDQAAALGERRLGIRATQEELLPGVQAVLADANVRLKDLAAVAVVNGPGSFTGVRIGLAAAKGLCVAAKLPLVTLSRLAVLAGGVAVRPVWAWLQAGRGDVYTARFALEEDPVARGTEPGQTEGEVLSMPSAAATAGGTAVAVQDAALGSAAANVIVVPQQKYEQSLRRAAAEAVRDRRWSDVALADALYLRVPDAELALRAKQA